MLLLNRLKTACALGISLAIFGLMPSVLAGQDEGVRAVVRVTDQKYCYADPEIFRVSLSLEITISNLSSKSIYFRSDMAAHYGQLASGLKEAHNGKFFQEMSPTFYPKLNQKSGRKIRVKAGRSVVLRRRYGVLARYNTTPKIDGTVPSGTYALQIVLHPEMMPPKKKRKRALREELKSITPEPFLFQVPKDPKITRCK